MFFKKSKDEIKQSIDTNQLYLNHLSSLCASHGSLVDGFFCLLSPVLAGIAIAIDVYTRKPMAEVELHQVTEKMLNLDWEQKKEIIKKLKKSSDLTHRPHSTASRKLHKDIKHYEQQLTQQINKERTSLELKRAQEELPNIQRICKGISQVQYRLTQEEEVSFSHTILALEEKFINKIISTICAYMLKEENAGTKTQHIITKLIAEADEAKLKDNDKQLSL